MVEGTVLTSKITWNKPKLGMSFHRANAALETEGHPYVEKDPYWPIFGA